MKQYKIKKISVRPAIGGEGTGIVVWVYHRKVQIQLAFDYFETVKDCIDEAVAAWYHAMYKLGDFEL